MNATIIVSHEDIGRKITTLTGIPCIFITGHVKKIVGISTDNQIVYENIEPNIQRLKSDNLSLSCTFVFTDLTKEGETIAHHIGQIMGLTHAFRLRVFHLSHDSILDSLNNSFQIDTNLVAQYEEQECRNILSGAKLSSYLYKRLCPGYEKKFHLNWPQLLSLRHIQNCHSKTNLFQKTFRYIKLRSNHGKQHCFQFLEMSTGADMNNTSFKKEDRVIPFEWTPPLPSNNPDTERILHFLFVAGYITYYKQPCFPEVFTEKYLSDYCQIANLFLNRQIIELPQYLPFCRPVTLMKSTASLAAKEKKVFNEIVRQTVLFLMKDAANIVSTLWTYKNFQLTTTQCASIDAKEWYQKGGGGVGVGGGQTTIVFDNIVPCEDQRAEILDADTETSIETQLHAFQNCQSVPTEHLTVLLRRGLIKACKERTNLQHYVLEPVGHFVLHVSKSFDSVEDILNINESVEKFEIATSDGKGRFIIGKYGLVFQKMNGEFQKVPADLDVEALLYGGEEILAPKEEDHTQNVLGYFHGQRVELKTGKYGTHACLMDKNGCTTRVSLQKVVGNRPLENIKWGEVYNFLLQRDKKK